MNKKVIVRVVFVSLLLLPVIGLYVWHAGRVSGRLELYVFDTKGNPSIFMRTPNDNRILIGGGSNSGIIRYLTQVLPFYSRRIDALVLTNDDKDNVTGLIDVVSRYNVTKVFVPLLTSKQLHFSSSTDNIYESFIDTIDGLNTPLISVKRGDRFDFDQVKIDILFPDVDFSDSKFVYSRSSSPEMIVRIAYGGTSFLLLGDAGPKIQHFLVDSNDNIKSDVLIISHGASAGLLTLDIVNTVKPKYVIYSQALTNDKKKKSVSSKIDPLYMILDDHRFNIKQKSAVKALSDGKKIDIR